ncbi:aBC transporter ATP-binding protein [Clostridium sp. CAG:411]|jgi:ATP-binding cassette subfamily B protein IrtB|nr:ABC transporter ATP-binding protein [Lachnospiraceae bacterium]CDE44262.1 aBC transporter ATP-binding protein [Clostridium sp. CAG:411]
MIKVIKKFLNFCQEENRKRFVTSIWLTLIQVLFEGLKVPAIYVLVKAVLEEQVTVKTAVTCFGIMLASILGAAFCKNKSTLLQTRAGYGTCADKRIEVAEHLRYVPMGYFNANTLGQVISVTTNTMQSLENVATRVIMVVSNAVLSTSVILLLIFLFDFRIGLIALAGVLLFVIFNHLLIARSAKLAKNKFHADQNLVDKVIEYVQGITEVKSYKLTGEQCRALNAANEYGADLNLKMEVSFVPFIAIQNFIVKMIGVAMAMASIAFYLNGTMELAVCIVMILVSYIMFAALDSASSFSALLRVVDVTIDKVNEIMASPQMDLEGEKVEAGNADIEVNNISFSYESRKIIDGISLKIPAKTSLAIVGPSGGGKTTLTNLIARFWDVDAGKITLNGKNIKKYNYDSLMANFSFVFQNVYLFKDTIANNIRFGTPEASMDKVMDAAKRACCHEFIMSLPRGYETVIGEDGINLSGGERQRISIARAIMKDSPIIILDEATANVDPENEEELIKAIEALTKEKTVIMIAHRLKTVRHADQIIVVDQGKIKEQGRHEDLMKQEGTYKKFIESREMAVSWKL